MAACCLVEQTLSVFYFCNHDQALGGSSFLKQFDLSSYAGKEWAEPNRLSRDTSENRSCLLDRCGDVLAIYGEAPELVKLDSAEVLYAERRGFFQQDWDDYSWVQYWNGKAYRGVSFDGEGVDVISLAESPVALERLDIDIEFNHQWHGQYFAGLRDSAGVAVYAVDEKRYVFEAPRERFVFRDDPAVLGGVAFDQGRVFFIAGDTLLVGDLESGASLFEIKYLASAKMQAFLQEFGYDPRNAYATQLAVQGDKVFLSSAILKGYILCIDLQRQDVVWLRGYQHRVKGLVTQGDLVYAAAALLPTAWDIHTGEQVWVADEGIDAVSAQISGQWLVFSGSAGDTKCFKLETPYHSPAKA
jgi:hypothetical protein